MSLRQWIRNYLNTVNTEIHKTNNSLSSNNTLNNTMNPKTFTEKLTTFFSASKVSSPIL